MKEEKCNQCGGDGIYVGTTSGHGCDGTEESCAVSCPVPIPIQEKCDLCEGMGQVEQGKNVPELSFKKEITIDDIPF